MTALADDGAVRTGQDLDRYEFDICPRRIDRDVVWEFMNGHAYWGRWRDRHVVDRQIDASWRVVGAYDRTDDSMVGFARAISDGVSLAYLADVFILPAHRGRGLGKHLLTVMIDEGPGAHFRWMLHTNDAHGLYAHAGFRPPDHTFLERPGRAPAEGRLCRPVSDGVGPAVSDGVGPPVSDGIGPPVSDGIGAD